MYAARIDGATRCLRKPDNMTEEECHSLHVRDEFYQDGTRYVASAWTPTPAELKMLQEGGNVIFKLMTADGRHPPMILLVEPAPPL
jgi:hypothetical protein